MITSACAREVATFSRLRLYKNSSPRGASSALDGVEALGAAAVDSATGSSASQRSFRLPILGLAGLLLTKEGMRDKDRADRRVIEQALAALEGGG
jgi:hypothetical protein